MAVVGNAPVHQGGQTSSEKHRQLWVKDPPMGNTVEQDAPPPKEQA